jgi:type I restriction enzyme M protein
LTDSRTTPNDADRLDVLIKAARRTMRKDKGLSTDLDRLPMLTWIMFLKFLDDLEQVEESRARLRGGEYRSTIEYPYRWRDWAAFEDGITGPELIEFVSSQTCTLPNGEQGDGLLTYLRALQPGDDGTLRRRHVVSTVFGEIDSRIRSGYLLRDILNDVNKIHFVSKDELFTLGHIYESMLREMRDAAGENGEFYTPRPVVRFLVDVVDPQLRETILDPACGTGGFLVEAHQHLSRQVSTVQDLHTLQEESLFGGEAKPLPFLLCQMNLLLHGIDAPEIDPGNSLRFRLSEIGDRERYDVILTNPPFGGEEEPGVRDNFPAGLQASETAVLFLQMIMRRLRRPRSGGTGGRAAVVLPNTTLFYDGVTAEVRRKLLTEFNLHTVVRLPKGVFLPYTDIETNIFFFEAGAGTQEILYYQVPLPLGPTGRELRQYTKTRPLTYDELSACVPAIRTRDGVDENSWLADASEVLADPLCSLDLHNPKTAGITAEDPLTLWTSIGEEIESVKRTFDAGGGLMESLHGILESKEDWVPLRLGDVLLRRREAIEVVDDVIYKRLTIKVKGRGVALRDEVAGTAIGTKRQFVVHLGQFVLSKIDAHNGAFGLVPDDCDGAIITGNFWAFDVDPNQLSPRLLLSIVQSPEFLDFCVRSSPGATNRRYLQEDKFLDQVISVPREIVLQAQLADTLDELSDAVQAQQRALLLLTEMTARQNSAALHRVFQEPEVG